MQQTVPRDCLVRHFFTIAVSNWDSDVSQSKTFSCSGALGFAGAWRLRARASRPWITRRRFNLNRWI